MKTKGLMALILLKIWWVNNIAQESDKCFGYK